MYIPKVRLSPSRLKTYDSCSYLYYAKYLEKVPDASNSGAAIGTAVHDTCEILFNKAKWWSFVEGIIKSRVIPDSVRRYMKISLTKSGFFSAENLAKAEKFLLVALDNDFWMEGAKIVKQPEEEFEIGEEYKIKGFLDKYAIYQDATGEYYAIIYDYKSQKNRFLESEIEFNIQAYAYLLYVKKRHPEINILKSSVKFILLAFPEDPIQEFKITFEGQLSGFEKFLKFKQQEVDEFNKDSRLENAAKNQPYPEKDGGFKGPIMCGRARFPGQMSAKGDKELYFCKYKFPFEYYVSIDKDGKIKETSRAPIKESDGLKVETRQYMGCEAFKAKKNTDTSDFIC